MSLAFGRFTIAYDGIRNWILTERVKTKVTKATKRDEDGNVVNEESERIVGFYSTLDAAARSLLRERIGSSTASSVSSLIEEIRISEKAVIDYVRSLDLSKVPAGRIAEAA